MNATQLINFVIRNVWIQFKRFVLQMFSCAHADLMNFIEFTDAFIIILISKWCSWTWNRWNVKCYTWKPNEMKYFFDVFKRNQSSLLNSPTTDNAN